MAQTPYEVGATLGEGWARMMRDNRIAMREDEGLDEPVSRVAGGAVPEAVCGLIRRSMHETGVEYLDNDERFWEGFVTGVRRYLDQQTQQAELGMGSN